MIKRKKKLFIIATRPFLRFKDKKNQQAERMDFLNYNTVHNFPKSKKSKLDALRIFKIDSGCDSGFGQGQILIGPRPNHIWAREQITSWLRGISYLEQGPNQIWALSEIKFGRGPNRICSQDQIAFGPRSDFGPRSNSIWTWVGIRLDPIVFGPRTKWQFCSGPNHI